MATNKVNNKLEIQVVNIQNRQKNTSKFSLDIFRIDFDKEQDYVKHQMTQTISGGYGTDKVSRGWQ